MADMTYNSKRTNTYCKEFCLIVSLEMKSIM